MLYNNALCFHDPNELKLILKSKKSKDIRDLKCIRMVSNQLIP